MLVIAKVFSVSAWIPSALIKCPRKRVLVCAKTHFPVLRMTLALRIRSRIVSMQHLHSYSSDPCTRMSSTRQITPGRPSRISFICLWKCSGALEMPNGMVLKQYRPNGVIKVVRWQLCSASGTCQKPLLASSLLNTLAPESWARGDHQPFGEGVSPVGRWC